MTGGFFERVNAMSPGAALIEYLRRGKSVFPVRSRTLGEKQKSKAPLVKSWYPYQTRLPPPAHVDQWLKRGVEALGFCTGAFNKYNILDADSAPAEKWLAANAPATVLQSVTKKGKHRWYRTGSFVVPSLSGIGPVPGIDCRGKGGFVVVPPSVIDGHKYTWEIGDSAQPIPTLDAMPPGFFVSSHTSPAQGQRKRAHGAENAGNGAFIQEQRYSADGLVAIGCRDDYLTRLIMGICASEKEETGKLPSPKYVAETAWRRFETHADLSDGEFSYENCRVKAGYTLERIKSGRIVIEDFDAEIGDATAYEEQG